MSRWLSSRKNRRRRNSSAWALKPSSNRMLGSWPNATLRRRRSGRIARYCKSMNNNRLQRCSSMGRMSRWCFPPTSWKFLRLRIHHASRRGHFVNPSTLATGNSILAWFKRSTGIAITSNTRSTTPRRWWSCIDWGKWERQKTRMLRTTSFKIWISWKSPSTSKSFLTTPRTSRNQRKPRSKPWNLPSRMRR